MNRQRTGWFVVGFLLLATAVLVMSRSDRSRPPDQSRRQVSFPRAMRKDDWQRLERRRTAPAPSGAALQADATPPSPPARDPLTAALATAEGSTALVFEANALTESPFGKLLLDCLRQGKGSRVLDQARDELGLDVTKDIDRVAVTDHGVYVSGNFENLRWDQALRDRKLSAYGEQGKLMEEERDSSREPPSAAKRGGLAVWGNQLIVAGDSPEAVKESLDRVEGRAASSSALREDMAYGEVYGSIGTDLIAQLLSGQPELSQKIRDATERIELHVDASRDVALVARFRGKEGSHNQELARSLAGLISIGRLTAQGEGQKELVELLDFARVIPGDRDFTLELALPLEFLEKQLSFCRAGSSPGQGDPGQSGD